MSQVAAVSRNPNQLDLFACGPDGRVYTSWWTAGSDWSGLGDRWRNIGGVFPPGAPVTAVSRNPNQLDLFVCGGDGRVYTSWWTAGSDWSGLGDNWRNIGGVFPPGAPVAAVSRNPNQLDLFVCGGDGRVYTSWWTAGSDWSGLGDNWRNIGGIFLPAAPLAAVSRNPNQLDLFICGGDGRVYTSWWTGGVTDWTGIGDKWRNIGGVFPSAAPLAAISRNPNQLDLFICGGDGRVYTSWWTFGSDWSGLGDNWRNIGGVFPPGAPPAAVSRNPNQLDVFIDGGDGRVYTSWWTAGSDWSGLGDKWRNIGGVFPAGAPLAAVSRNPNQLDLFIDGGDGRVYTSWWTAGSDWSGLGDRWRNIGAPIGAPPANIGALGTGSITFSGGVPVGGWSQLTMWPDGSYVFEGSFHDSGFPSYNDALVWVVKDNLTNTAYTFGHSGHMAGTIESGSRDDSWNVQSRSAALQAVWNNFGGGWTWHWEADVNADFNSVLDKALAVAGDVLGVVQIVAAA